MLERLFRVFREDPVRIPVRLWGRWWALRLSWQSNVALEGKVTVLGKPLIDTRKGSKLTLGKGVILTSRNKGCRAQLKHNHSAVPPPAGRCHRKSIQKSLRWAQNWPHSRTARKKRKRPIGRKWKMI